VGDTSDARARQRFRQALSAPRPRRTPRQTLTPREREGVLALLHEERFVDLPPGQVWAQMLDAGQVPPCSIRTMYRVLAANAEVRERRNQLRHPAYHKPELLATGPNQVWSFLVRAAGRRPAAERR
jgi:putative transposase